MDSASFIKLLPVPVLQLDFDAVVVGVLDDMSSEAAARFR